MLKKVFLLPLSIFTLILILLSCSEPSAPEDTVNPDTTPPEISIVSPQNNSTFEIGSNIYYKVEASDNDTISSVTFFINDVQVHQDTTDTYSYSWHTSAIGTYSLHAIVFDPSNNQASSEVITINIIESFFENNPPEPPTTPSPENNALNVDTDLTLNWDCIDPDGDSLTNKVYLGFDQYLNEADLIADNHGSNSLQIESLDQNCDYYWKVIVSDGEISTIGSTWQFHTYRELNQTVFVQGGSFQMGDRLGNGQEDELPLHYVTISSFHMGKFEVTHEEFILFLNAYGIHTYYGNY